MQRAFFHSFNFPFDLEWVGLVTSLQGCCDWVNQNNIDSTLLAGRYIFTVLILFVHRLLVSGIIEISFTILKNRYKSTKKKYKNIHNFVPLIIDRREG